jgi:hypothetical protein
MILFAQNLHLLEGENQLWQSLINPKGIDIAHFVFRMGSYLIYSAVPGSLRILLIK